MSDISDLKSKNLVYEDAYHFLQKPSKDISKKDLDIAINILKEIEEWETKYSGKDYSVLKNSSVLVAYLAYKFGMSVGLTKHELSDVYIAGLVQNIGKIYMCGEDMGKAYEYFSSPLKVGDEGFEPIAEAFRKYPLETERYLKTTSLNQRIAETAINYHVVHSRLFKDE